MWTLFGFTNDANTIGDCSPHKLRKSRARYTCSRWRARSCENFLRRWSFVCHCEERSDAAIPKVPLRLPRSLHSLAMTGWECRSFLATIRCHLSFRGTLATKVTRLLRAMPPRQPDWLDYKTNDFGPGAYEVLLAEGKSDQNHKSQATNAQWTKLPDRNHLTSLKFQ